MLYHSVDSAADAITDPDDGRPASRFVKWHPSRWVGLSYDGKIVTGWGAMTRNEHDAAKVIDELKQHGGMA